jgi:hypothetical protein
MEAIMPRVHTRAQWAARIRAAHTSTVKAILKLGRTLLAAKEGPHKLPHGEFLKMIKNDLPFGARAAQMLMTIAGDARLANPNHGSLLPAHWRTMFELTKLPDETFEQGVSAGAWLT